MSTQLPDDAEVQSCLERILASPIFAHAERQKRLLNYLVTETLAGRCDRLKGYTIGLEVFDRDASFDPAIDAIVRVQAAQVRAKLREYYDGEGGSEPIRFELPKGGYAIRICCREREGAPCIAPIEAAAQSVSPTLTPIKDKPSLAVLPFVNMSSDPEQEYFADGITEDLTTELSRLSGLFVISRNSAFVYKGKPKRAEEIGTELGVRYLVEGSVRRAENQVRISAQLIDTVSGDHVWAERYDRELNDIFAVQDDVTRRIVEVLQVKLAHSEAERSVCDGVANIAAHDMLLRGRERFFVFTRESSEQAKDYFRKALEIDPLYAAAHARLAQTHVRDWTFDWTRDRGALEKALEHTQKAIELDPRLPYAHATLGWVQLWRGQGKEAIAFGRRAVELDQNNADARLFLSFALGSLGYGEEAMKQIELALRLNPHPSPIYLNALGACHYVAGNYEQAIAANERGLEINSAFTPCLRVLVVLYTLVGRLDDARRARETLLQRLGGARPAFSSSFFLDPALAERYERDRKAAWGE